LIYIRVNTCLGGLDIWVFLCYSIPMEDEKAPLLIQLILKRHNLWNIFKVEDSDEFYIQLLLSKDELVSLRDYLGGVIDSPLCQ